MPRKAEHSTKWARIMIQTRSLMTVTRRFQSAGNSSDRVLADIPTVRKRSQTCLIGPLINRARKALLCCGSKTERLTSCLPAISKCRRRSNHWRKTHALTSRQTDCSRRSPYRWLISKPNSNSLRVLSRCLINRRGRISRPKLK